MIGQFRTGDEAIVVAKHNGHRFPIGTRVEITGIDYTCYTCYDGTDHWFLVDSELRHITPSDNDQEVTMINSNIHAFPVGAKVKVAEKNRSVAGGPIYPKMDITYTVESCRTTGTGFQVAIEGFRSEFGSDWFVWAERPASAVDRVPFTLTKDTSREYAARQVSKKLDDDTNKVLRQAAAGEEVDAFAFRDALVQAMSAAMTRDGASTARRNRASNIRHLFYIVNGVLDNMAKALPPVDPGARSPRIAELEAKVAEYERWTTNATDALKEARDCIKSQRETLDEAQATIRDSSGDVTSLEAKVAALESLVIYAGGLLEASEQAQVVGFADAKGIDLREIQAR